MEKALAMSRGETDWIGQEVGVVGKDGVSKPYGPVTNPDPYDPKQWAMVTTHGSEITPDMEPRERQQHGAEPRFLKPLPSGDYLPNLLTIAHSIPLAREALLQRTNTRFSYGQDPDWWRGHAIRLPKIVHTADGSLADADTANYEELVAEMQRLVAFLGSSDRSYASAESLAHLDILSKSDKHALIDKVLEMWEVAVRHTGDASESSLFCSQPRTSDPEQGTTPDMWTFPLDVGNQDPAEGFKVTLAELMDTTIWDSDPSDESFCDTWMDKCADVLPIHISSSDTARQTLGVTIPSTLYMDKYLKENIPATRETRKEMAKMKIRMNKIDNITSRLMNVKHPTKKGSLPAEDVARYTRSHYNGENRRLVLEEREARGMDLNMVVAPEPEHYSQISAKLDEVYNSIQEKLIGQYHSIITAFVLPLTSPSARNRKGKGSSSPLSTLTVNTTVTLRSTLEASLHSPRDRHETARHLSTTPKVRKCRTGRRRRHVLGSRRTRRHAMVARRIRRLQPKHLLPQDPQNQIRSRRSREGSGTRAQQCTRRIRERQSHQ